MKKRPFLQRPVGVLFMTLAGAAVGVAIARSGLQAPALELGPGGPVALVALLPLVYFIVIGAHELGHVAGGLLVDFRPLLLIVGPLRVERTRDDGARYGLNRSFGLAGGLAVCAPVELHDLRRRTIILVAGGPLASFMFGAQVLALYQATSGALMTGDAVIARLAGVLLVLVGIGSLLVGVATLLPMRTDGFYSDGARLLRLMRADEETEREVALLALTGMSIGGVRPGEWDGELVARCAGIADGGPFEVAARQFAYAHALDRGDVEAARTHLAAAVTLVDQLPAGSRPSLLLTAATFHALYDNDPEPARTLLDRTGTQSLLTTPHERVLAEAAMRLADGDLAGAVDAARRAQALVEQSLDRGGSALDHSMAGLIIERAGGTAAVAVDAARDAAPGGISA